MNRRLWPLNLLFAAGAVWFSLQSWRHWTGGLEAPPPAPAEEKAVKGERVQPVVRQAPAPAADYQIIEDRNLFSQSRAPAPPPAREAVEVKLPAAAPEAAPDRWALYGVIRLDPGRYFALIKDRKTPNAKTQLMSVGDVLGPGQVVRKIDDRRVLLSGRGGDLELKLRSPKGPEDTGFRPQPLAAASPAANIQAEQQRRAAAMAPQAAPVPARPGGPVQQGAFQRRGVHVPPQPMGEDLMPDDNEDMEMFEQDDNMQAPFDEMEEE